MDICGKSAVFAPACPPTYCSGTGIFIQPPPDIGENFAQGDCNSNLVLMELSMT